MKSKWSLNIHVDGNQKTWAILQEDGKVNYQIEISLDQLAWFNALRNLLGPTGRTNAEEEGR